MKRLIYLLGLTLFVNFFSSCQEEVPDLNLNSRVAYFEPLDPTEAPDRLCQELGITGGELLVGTLPEAKNNKGIKISHYQQSAELSPGTTIYLPLNYTITGSNVIAGIYLHVVGSDHYWNVPISKIGRSSSQSKNSRVNNDYNSIVLPINLPEYVIPGTFTLSYTLYDQQGNTSSSASTHASVQPASEGCGFRAHGKEGLYTKKILLGEEPGTIGITYNMYTIPDRMDIKYNGEWVASTATTPLLANEDPPSSVCYDGTEGYVSGSRTLSVDYDPSLSKYLEIYMYGCFESTTEWDFSVSCQPQGQPKEPECCEDTPTLPDFTPNIVNFPANHIGKLNTGVLVNKGDYVFVGTKGRVILRTIPSLTTAEGESGLDELIYNRYKKYPNFKFGQLIAWTGERSYGFDNIRLGENECEEIWGDAIGTAYLFRGEDGNFFKAQQTGEILLELNDNDPSNNKLDFSVEIYVLKLEDHFGRNRYNCCPDLEPTGQDPCNNNYDPDNEASAECYHGGLDTYRGSGPRVAGSQCTYRNGAIVNQGGIMGTFDYGEPKTRLHMILDVFPHIVLGDEYQPTPEKNIYP